MSDSNTQGFSINLVVMGRGEQLDVPEGTTLAEVLEQRGIDADSAIRFRGESVDGSGREVVLVPGDTVIATPPNVDHG